MKGIKFLTAALAAFLVTSPAMAEMISGKITSLSPEKSIIIVNTEVMGLAGPEKRNVAFRMDDRTLLNLCWGQRCDSGAALTGLERINEFNYFEAEELSVMGKRVEMEYRDGTDTLETVSIYAPAPTYYFNPADFVSSF